MSGSTVELRMEVSVGPEADSEALESATRLLRQELLELDVAAVERPPGGPPPPGARSIEALALGALVVTATEGAVGAIFHVLRGWLRRDGARSVKLEIDGDSIEIADPSDETERQLIEAFLSRHGAPPPP